MQRLFLLCFIVLFSIVSNAQDLNRKIDSLIQAEFKEINGPGGVFLIAKKGKPIYKKAFGMANLELDSQLNTNSVFQIGSMTKQFTAIAILMLEEHGKLKVSDAVSKYIPSYPNGDKITIHDLLTHTSGIKDFTKMKALQDIAQKEMTPEQMVDFFKNEPVDFAPREKFDYNNSGYVVLGYIIELASGGSYEDFIKKNIFDKAEMTNSFYASDRKIIKNRAFGYHKKSSGYVNKTMINFSVPFSSGSLMSTLDDMLKWQNALNHNLLLTSKEETKAFTKYKLNNGQEIEYGYGWHLKNINGTPTREHGGSIFGFKSMAVYIPEKDIYVVGFSNCDCNSPTQLVKDIAKLSLENSKDK
ncbi:beta-lactamase family protein [Chryseobacterium aahli]|uniref:serine hydrolase domain-containing protein n=1 Tax=Chryseobacterium aahli TaxID=1278643 RepID=UPI001F603752|nr:serine hydrolase domain-containing protein [Chryseobacterium aahli]MCI3937237.1 beta-lactamase family protein [Chryseobacterium aahli]